MKRLLAASLTLAFAGSLWANADIEITSVTQDPVTRVVRVDYTIGYGPAILTMAVKNKSTGERIPGFCVGSVGNALEPNYRNLGLVTDGDHTIFWRAVPDASGAGVSLPAEEMQVCLNAWDPNDPPPYMLVDLNHAASVTYATSTDDLPFGGGVTNEIYKTDWMVFRRIPAKNVTWRMGAPDDENPTDPYKGHETPHYVTLEHDYYIGVFPVTRYQYLKMTGGKAASWTDVPTYGDERFLPASGMSIEDLRGTHANGACLNDYGRDVVAGSVFHTFRKFTGLRFDLPTEAQWEFACRGGTGTPYNDGSASVSAVGWCNSNSYKEGAYRLQEVGLLAPNSFGLYDMHGNVFELCPDVYVASVSADPVTEPTGGACNGASAGNTYITKGGSYGFAVGAARSAATRPQNHGTRDGSRGFRIWCQIGED